MAIYPLPPFFPAGGVIQLGVWADHGEWNDEQIMFPYDDPDPDPTDEVVTQGGNIILTQDGQEILIQ